MLEKNISILAGGLLALGLAASQPARADTVTAIVPAAQSVALESDGKATMAFTVSGAAGGADACGIWINYGDGDSPDTRIISRQEGQFPRVFEHRFNRAGQFAVTVKGERVRNIPGCTGTASTTINVVAQVVPGRRDIAAACPAGWGLIENSYVRRTGAYSCAPLYPADRMDCGRGLRYFEEAGQIGCRARGQGRER